jgi:hypothetical protein
MKKLSPVLALSLATCAACGGGATGPNPAEAPGGKVIAWTGTAERTVSLKVGVLDSTTTWAITGVTWVEDVNPDVAPLPGQTLYKIGSGRVKETIHQVSGPCVVTGDAEYTLQAGDGALTVTGTTYSGIIKRRVDDEIKVTGDCGYGAGSANLAGRLEMQISSANDTVHSASHLRGSQTVTVAASKQTATWDFTATAWER